jgi:hypothetical protein
MSSPEHQVPRRDAFSGDASKAQIEAFWATLTEYSVDYIDAQLDQRIDATLHKLESSYHDPTDQLGRQHAELQLVLGGIAKAKLHNEDIASSSWRPAWLQYVQAPLIDFIAEDPEARAALTASNLYRPNWNMTRALSVMTHTRLNPDWHYDNFSFAAAVALGKQTIPESKPPQG